MPARILLATALAAALSGIAWLWFLPFPRDSDMANFALAGLDMAKGNWRLAGWWLPSDNDATLDIPLYALAARFGAQPLAAAYVVPAMLWGATGTLAILAAVQGAPARAGWAASGVLACLAVPAMLAPRPGFQVSMAPDHIACVAVLLLALLALDRAVRRPGPWRPASLMTAAILLLLAVIGDPMAVFIGVLPIMAASAVSIRRREQARFHAALCVICASTVPLAKMLLAWNTGAGGFVPIGLRFSVSPPTSLLPHLLLTVKWLVQYLGADPTRISPFNPASLVLLIRFPLVLLFGWACLATGHRVVRSGKPPRYLDTVLWFALAADLASTALSGLIVDEASSRYVIPAYVFGSILLARNVAGGTLEKGAIAAALACTAVMAGGALARGVPPPASAPRDLAAMAAALDRSGAAAAYAPYGAASLATALMQGRVPVRALWTGDRGRLRPFPWLANADWYRASAGIRTGRVAFVVHEVSPVDAFDQHDVEALMGPPRDQIRSGNYLIDLYDAGGAAQASLVP